MRGEWAGIPMPLEGESLVVEPRYPHAQALMALCGEKDSTPEDEGLKGSKIRNRFWSSHRRSEIVMFELADGRIDWGLLPGVHHFDHDLKTLGCADAWGLEQEHRAQKLLASLVDDRKFRQYIMTGTFLERSQRSGLFYLFRRLKPTVAIDTSGRRSCVRCALCLHPIAYYAGSWAGAMCPTDDVIAALMLMRGDEHRFWKKSNQHPAYRPEAGL